MADIGSRSVGVLNVHKVYRGYQKTFKTIHPGDLSMLTVSAHVENSGGNVPLTVVKSAYDSVTQTTTINYILSAEQSALLSLGKLEWAMILTENLIPQPYLEGFFEVLDL